MHPDLRSSLPHTDSPDVLPAAFSSLEGSNPILLTAHSVIGLPNLTDHAKGKAPGEHQ
jgi:hypothetical protein